MFDIADFGTAEQQSGSWKGPLKVVRIPLTEEMVEWPCSLRGEFHGFGLGYSDILLSLDEDKWPLRFWIKHRP